MMRGKKTGKTNEKINQRLNETELTQQNKSASQRNYYQSGCFCVLVVL